MGRAPCCDKNGLKKGPWTPEEDLKLTTYIQTHGPGNWRTLPKNAGLERCGKSCRLRWTNYLRPDIKRGRFSFEEEETIIQLHSVLGNKWSAIAARLPGRTDNEIKNYWNTHIRKRLLRMGIDPVTHAPRVDLLDISSILTAALRNHSLLTLSGALGSRAPAVNPELLSVISTLLTPRQDSPAGFPLQGFLHAPPQSHAPVHDPAQERLTMDMVAQLMQEDDHSENPEILRQSFIGHQGSVTEPNYGFCGENPTASEIPEVSVKSTPLNSSSTNINNSSSSNEDERDSFCSNFFKFEIPEGFDFEEFM